MSATQKRFRSVITQRPFDNPAQSDRDLIIQRLNDAIRRLQGAVESGSVVVNVATVTANHTLSATDNTILADATAGAIVVTLPDAATVGGQEFTVKKLDSSANAVTLTPIGTQTVDHAATAAIITQYVALKIVSDGANWWII